MSTEVIQILDALCEKFGLAIDWTSDNVIPYLQQIGQRCVNYQLASSILWIVFGSIFLIMTVIGIVHIHKNPDFGVERYTSGDSDGMMRFLAYLSLSFLSFLFITMIVSSCLDIIKCLTFPELIILEQLKDIYKSIK
jgi:hypothetical protein